MLMKEPVLLVGPGIRVEVREDMPPGKAYLVDAAAVTQTNPDGTLKHPFSVVRLDNIGE